MRRKAGENGSLLRSRGSSLEGRRSPRSSAGVNLALPAWSRLLAARALSLLTMGFVGLYTEMRSFHRDFDDLLEGRVIE